MRLRFLRFILEQGANNCNLLENGEFHSDPVCTDPVENFPPKTYENPPFLYIFCIFSYLVSGEDSGCILGSILGCIGFFFVFCRGRRRLQVWPMFARHFWLKFFLFLCGGSLWPPFAAPKPLKVEFSPKKKLSFAEEDCLARGCKGMRTKWSDVATMGHTPSTAGTFRRKFRKNSRKTPETLSERFLEFPSRVRLGSPKPCN